MLKYLKAAFKNRWNLLALMAGTGVAIIGRRADIVIPLMLAAEASGVVMILLRVGGQVAPSAAVTRWSVASATSSEGSSCHV